MSRIWRARPNWTLDALACAIIVALGYVYFLPLSYDLLRPNTTRMMGDGTDMTSQAWQYHIIVDTLLHAPSRLLFGTIYTENMNAPTGEGLWIPWIERVLVPLLAPITNDANIPTAVAWALMSINGVSTYLFGRIMKWPRLVSMTAGLCFAYNNYTRARANVHVALVGAFGIALIFIALELLSNRELTKGPRKRRTMLWASAALLVATFSAHYYLFIFIILTPFFFLFFWLRRRTSGMALVPALGRMMLCSLPAVLFLAWNFLMPVPPQYRGVLGTPEVRPENFEYLHAFGAHPIDYLGFDLKLGKKDWLKARAEITESIRPKVVPSNEHERSNGIRWSLLVVAVLAAASLLRRPEHAPSKIRSRQFQKLFLLFGIICFLFSLPPQGLKSFDDEIGPSLLVFKLFPNFRVPCRFGIFAQFAVIAIVCEFISSILRTPRLSGSLANRALSLTLPVIVTMDYAPLNPVMIAKVSYVRKELVLPDAKCGMGIALPYSYWVTNIYQETRGLNCRILITGNLQADRVLQRFTYNQAFDTAKQKQFVDFAQCTGLDWATFAPVIPRPAREAICGKLGWAFVSDDSCRAPAITPNKKTALQCLQ